MPRHPQALRVVLDWKSWVPEGSQPECNMESSNQQRSNAHRALSASAPLTIVPGFGGNVPVLCATIVALRTVRWRARAQNWFGQGVDVLIAIEGIDGSGKGTQTTLLSERLSAMGHVAKLFRYPQYEESFFGREVGQYLNGDFGPLEAVHPKFSALLYALDRFQSLQAIRDCLSREEIVICDRYTPSNVAHQSARVSDNQKEQMADWIETVEYNILSLPKPDLIIFLDIDVEKSQELVGQKSKRSYTQRSHDLHEESKGHLSDALTNFRRMAQSKGWRIVNCAKANGNIRSISEISDEILAATLTLINE
jgi:dTMP kinase